MIRHFQDNHILLSMCESAQPKPVAPLPQQIGWYHLMLGRVAIQWGTIIAYHLTLNQLPEREMRPLI